MDVYSTAGVPTRRRTSYWNEVYASHFAQVSFDPVNRENFEAELRTGTMGPLGLARVSYHAANVERTRSHIDRTRQRLFSTTATAISASLVAVRAARYNPPLAFFPFAEPTR